MSNPLHARWYADRAVRSTVELAENVRIAEDTFRARFFCPKIAQLIKPGQFVMVRIAGANDPLIARPFALYDVVLDSARKPLGIDIVYLVQGKMTSLLSRMSPAVIVDVWGPLGNGFPMPATSHLIMVAGGIGYTPFLAVAKQWIQQQQAGKVTLCYGAKSASFLASIDDFVSASVNVQLATDDGTRGHHGRVTDVLQKVLEADTCADSHVICCGPDPMMAAVANITKCNNTPCHVSLETPMACGIGICFSCVARVKDELGEWDYRRTCVEGPVFAATSIQW